MSTKLQKYIATISEVLSLKENEVDWLARHLGHDVMVHREFCFWLWMAAKSASGRENVLMKSTLMVSILKHLLLLNLFFYF